MQTAIAMSHTRELPGNFGTKSAGQISEELLGFPPSCRAAALRYHELGDFADLGAMLPGFIAFHLPSGTAHPTEPLTDNLRLQEDLGLDSLALTEMAFKMEDLFGITVETREVMKVQTVGDLKAFLKRQLTAA